VDFLSWHEYPVGDNMNPPLDGPGIYKAVMQKLPKLGREVTNAEELVAAHRAHGFTDGHPIPIYYGEYNMNWNWVATGWGQDKYVGAAYFGGALTELAHANVDWAGNWSAKDDYFGLIDMNDKLRPPAYVYMFANHYLIGSMAQSSSDDPDVYCLAIDRGPSAQGDKHAVMLTNTFYNTKTVNLKHGLTVYGLVAKITTVDKTGVHTSTRFVGTTNSTFVMPGFSVAMITMP